MSSSDPIRVAILDDYQQVALTMADWSQLENKAVLTVFYDHLSDPAALIKRLMPFEVIGIMRERTPMPREILQELKNLKLVISTGRRNASLDTTAAGELGIRVMTTGYLGSGAPELTWALLLAIARQIVPENESVRSGGWQKNIGTDLKGKTIGILGLGNIGSKIARIANAFEMNVLAWSTNLKPEDAAAHGATWVTKEQLFREADFVTVHLVLSPRSRGIVGPAELSLMKASAYLINTSRGPLIDEQALIRLLKDKKIAGAALDVFDEEPLPADHPFRSMDNVLITPHIGYVTRNTYAIFYQDTVNAILEYLGR
jgi:phosphoglycerate dehydrogenase-like enzyme